MDLASAALTVKHVVRMLNVNERTVYRMVQWGELPAFKVAGKWRFLMEDIMAWIEAQKHEVALSSQPPSKLGGSENR